MGIRNLLEREDLCWPGLIAPVSHPVNNQLHRNSRRWKLLCTKRKTCKGTEIDAKGQTCSPLKWNRFVPSQKSRHTHITVLLYHTQRIEHRRVAQKLKHAINPVWILLSDGFTQLAVLDQDACCTKLKQPCCL